MPAAPAAMLACLTATYLVFFASVRFHYPMVPLLAMYAGAGLSLLLQPRASES